MTLECLPRRYQVRQSVLGSIRIEMCTDEIEGAFDLFMTFKGAMEAGIDAPAVSQYFDDAQSFCVWDTKTENVAFYKRMYLTTYILGEIDDEEES